MSLSTRVQAQINFLDTGAASRVFDEFSYQGGIHFAQVAIHAQWSGCRVI
jgi:hypothetical protein